MSSNPYQAPVGSITPDPVRSGKGKATASLVLGLISIITWLIPLIGMPTTITGLVLGIKGLRSPRQGVAIAGIVLSTIFLFLTIVNMGIGAYLGATGRLPSITSPAR